MNVKSFSQSQKNCENSQMEYITVTVELENNTNKFKVKPSTKASKYFNSYCQRRNLTTSAFKVFNEDGERVNLGMTVGDLKLVDGSVLTLRRQQSGGLQNKPDSPL